LIDLRVLINIIKSRLKDGMKLLILRRY